ncbi:HXXEE domain-containing protein [Paenibacillus thiaminolyticus]|uniref:HXXEE domain-containing protein n=1 Tax=Paenibacillus thiaminolyticus TaxID=49283 RepID=UPI0011647CF4|nr:HXXEE domain-containing protein [Paenibacillus thiaminolyticus]NGP58351.1 HXXEE domain-containing protein [Paenibacillus thiaminolyticus]WCR26596.1 HXXEE domain-containing protein [Paenibacillus thiaminolyticus]
MIYAITGWITAHLDAVTVMWLFPIVFMFHDFEEILYVEPWIRRHGDRILRQMPPAVRRFAGSSLKMTTRDFAGDVFWVFLVIVTATLAAVLFSWYDLYLILVLILFLHVFTHIGLSVYTRTLAPGVITAVLLVLPYSGYAFFRLFADHVIVPEQLLWDGLAAIVLFPAIFLLMSRWRSKFRTAGE